MQQTNSDMLPLFMVVSLSAVVVPVCCLTVPPRGREKYNNSEPVLEVAENLLLCLTDQHGGRSVFLLQKTQRETL